MSKAPNGISSARTVATFINGRACSDTLFHVLNHAFDIELIPEELAVTTFAGGIMQHGYQCGMIWGAALSAGMQAYQLHGPGPKAETYTVLAAQKLVQSFQAQNIHINCIDITEINRSSSTYEMIKYFLLQGGSIGCFRRAAKYANEALPGIKSVLSEEPEKVPEAPVSCSALLAQKAGVSDQHVVMAAGFAGGIGLCGGVCGALGAAIWIIGLNAPKERDVKNLWKDEYFNAKFEVLMEQFLKQTGFEFECSKIVGRNFEDAADHAAYVCNGGCSGLIEELASAAS